MWLRSVPGSSEADFAAALKKPEDCIVVWHDRGEQHPIENQFPLIEKTIRENYIPLVRLGDIDIWTKIPAKSNEKARNASPAADKPNELKELSKSATTSEN